MNTNEKLIAIIRSMGGREFADSDWAAFGGCQSENPWIAEHANYIVVADGENLEFYPSDSICDGESHVILSLS